MSFWFWWRMGQAMLGVLEVLYALGFLVLLPRLTYWLSSLVIFAIGILMIVRGLTAALESER